MNKPHDCLDTSSAHAQHAQPSEQTIAGNTALTEIDIDTLSLNEARNLLRELRESDAKRKAVDADLAATKNQLKTTLDAIPDLLFEIDEDGHYYKYHAHQADLLAAPPETLLGKTMYDVLPADAALVCQSAIQEAAESGRSVGKTYSLQLPQGKYWFELSVAALPKIAGQDRRFIALARDITERKNSEEAQRRSEGKWRSLVKNAPNFILLIDREYRYTYVNHVQAGFTVDDFIGKSALDTVPEEDRAALGLRYARIFSTGQPDTWEIRAAIGPNQFGWYRIHVGPIYEDQQITSLLIVSSDITASKVAEAELRIAAVAFECQEGIIVMDTDFACSRSNHAFTEITGYTQKEIQGQPTEILHSQQHSEAYYETLRARIRQSGLWQGELWLRRKDHQEFLAQMTVTAVKNEQGVIAHFVATVTDITDRHREQQRRLAHEAAHRAALVREVHHRIKNNLQGITGLLRMTALREPALLKPINQTIGQVQSISVIHGLQGRSDSTSVRLCELTSEIAQEIQQLWQISIPLTIEPNWTYCLIAEDDAVPIALILHELIVNAVKHSNPARQTVSIALQKASRPDVVQVRIVNAGCIAAVANEKIPVHTGLPLVSALMPHEGAKLIHEQQGDQVLTLLELAPPVFSFGKTASP